MFVSLRYCSSQEIALREHRSENDNKGNFMGAVDLVLKHSQELRDLRTKLPLNAHYLFTTRLFFLQLDAARGVFELEKPPVHSVLQLGDYLLTFRKAFNLVLSCIAVAITIPVSSCSAERSFSAVKRIMTRLRTTMTNDRLSDLTVLSTHSALANNLDEDDLVTRFLGLRPRR